MHKIFMVAAVFLHAVFLHGQVNPGPVAKYSFNNGNAKDEAGHNDAKAYGVTPTKDRFGNSRSAYFFHGNPDCYINLGTSNVLKPKVGTISLWVYMEKIAYKGKGIAANPFIYTRAFGGDDFNEAYAIIYDYGVGKLEGTNSLSEFKQVYIVPEKTYPIQRWYHLVLTYDNHFSCFYIDGALVIKAEKNFESTFYEGDSVLVGIRNGPKNVRFFEGVIDDIEIYNRVLLPHEVLALYHAPNPNKRAIVITWIAIGVAIVVFIVLLIWFIRFRIRRAVHAEQERHKLNNRLIELETRAIRSQMNPHFVFNSLNTLQRFVLEDNKEKAYNYLIAFSRLLRKLIESSELDTISLKEEIEILTSYLDIEKSRFDDSFEYRVSSDIEQMDQVYIPFMLVQPFAENAIWHGLLNKKGVRSLTITFKHLDEARILCEVNDNGVGRNFKSPEQPDQIKRKSLALDFIRQRLELLRQSTGVACSFEIIDKTDEHGNSLGTLVKLIIPKLK